VRAVRGVRIESHVLIRREPCPNKKRAMEATREAVKGIINCTSAYCSVKVTCDYYVRDNDKFYKYNTGDCPRNGND
jgi:hypothetical protein